jgi:hypothetical protein
VGLFGACVLLIRGRPAFERSGADDPDAHSRLRFRDQVGAAAPSRGSSQLGLSMMAEPRALKAVCGSLLHNQFRERLLKPVPEPGPVTCRTG